LNLNELNSKELFELVLSYKNEKILSLKEILSEYDIIPFSINEVLNLLRDDPGNILLIDARSEKEFSETSIPHAINFPVLTNEERHNVGLVYKKYSQSAAIRLAVDFAEPKTNSLRKFLEENKAGDKQIIVNCWRGGGRSSYLSKMISDLGYSSKVISGGIKSFRKEVNKTLTAENFPYELIEISGLTGCGKTDLLKSVSDKLPVIDLENAARHFSSLLGHIPYEIKGIRKVSGQTEFENNIYSQIRLNNSKYSIYDNPGYPFLIESESKRVGKFNVPENIYIKMEAAKTVKLTGSLDHRISRIIKDYFSDRDAGIKLMLELFRSKENFFRQQLSKILFDDLILKLENGNIYEFTEITIKDYYDKRYREKKKTPVMEINTDDMDKASAELEEFYVDDLSGDK